MVHCDTQLVSKNYAPGIHVKNLQIMSFAEWSNSKDGVEEMHRCVTLHAGPSFSPFVPFSDAF